MYCEQGRSSHNEEELQLKSDQFQLNESYTSSCIWQSDQSFKPPELDGNIELSASFHNLYQQAFNSSIGSTSMTHPRQQQQLLRHQKLSCVFTDWLQRGLQDASIFASNVLSPTETPQEMQKNLGMSQFQAMIDSMQGRELQTWLAECTDELAVSWREFLSHSICKQPACWHHQGHQNICVAEPNGGNLSTSASLDLISDIELTADLEKPMVVDLVNEDRCHSFCTDEYSLGSCRSNPVLS